MFESVIVAPSLLSADFMRLGDEMREIEAGGAGWAHVDVMDGHFVPNLTIGVPVVRQLARSTELPLDVHLMIGNPLEQLPWYLECLRPGTDIVSVHAEALPGAGLAKAVRMMHEAGVRAAVALKPKTPASAIEDVVDEVDMVLVMSVEPGFSGQSYIAGSEDKVAQVASLAETRGSHPLIEVDGGISSKTAPLVARAGADVLVCGNAVFAADDRALAIARVIRAAEQARERALSA